LLDESLDALHRCRTVVTPLLRMSDDVAEFVGFCRRDREARLLLLEFGKTLEFGIGQKFRHCLSKGAHERIHAATFLRGSPF